MRATVLLPLLMLAGCGGGDEPDAADANAAATAAPAPRTPVLDVTPAPGNRVDWLEPRPAPDAPRTAPYGNLLDTPLVDAPPAR